MSRILVLTGYDDAMSELGDITTPSKQAWAERHGYAFECVRTYTTDIHPSWQKMRFIRERIASFDAIVWLDADSVITDPTWTVDDIMDPNNILTVSVDWCAPNEPKETTVWISMGNFVIRNTGDTLLWLNEVDRYEAYGRRAGCCWEQDAVIQCMKRIPWFNSRVTRLPRWTLNAVHDECRLPHVTAPEPWWDGCFLIHLTNVPDRVGKAKYFATLAP